MYSTWWWIRCMKELFATEANRQNIMAWWWWLNNASSLIADKNIKKCLKGHFKTKMRCICIIARLSECRCKLHTVCRTSNLTTEERLKLARLQEMALQEHCAWLGTRTVWGESSHLQCSMVQAGSGQVWPCPGFAFVALFFLSLARKITLAVQ
jgi:hypothetical protein